MQKALYSVIIVLFLGSAVYSQDGTDGKNTIVREKNTFVNPSDNEFIGKLGTGYAADPDKFGLDLSINYIYNLDPYFVFGFECDFFWINWENRLGDVSTGSAVNGTLKAETNLYTVPVFANAQLRLPLLRDKIFVEPFITVGLGYSFMILDYSSTEKDGTDFYSGFAWQVILTAAYRMPQGSAVDFLFDIGYRGIDSQKGDIEIDMSGPVARLGVRIYI